MHESHEAKFLSVFDSLLEGSRIRKEVDRILTGVNVHTQQLIDCLSPKSLDEANEEQEE